MPSHYDLIVFDWDGTLMDSEAKIVRCFAKAAEEAGAVYPGDQAVHDIIGLGLQEAIEILFSDETKTVQAAVLEGYREYFLHRDNTEMPLFPGVDQGLQELLQRGHLLAVATGKARRGLDRVLEESPIKDLFVTTRCADETHSKPHPRMLREILTHTNVAPERAIMVGDTIYDLEMARNAGMDALAVSYGVQPCDRLLSYKPLACMDSFAAVCAWLQ